MAITRSVGLESGVLLAVVAMVSGAMLGSPAPAQGATQWTPARTLTGLIYHAMAYDARRQRVVMFGGFGYGGRSGTWEWDGTVWMLRTPAMSPSPRSGHAMAYDAARGRVVLFGGEDPMWSLLPSETWEWDGVTWRQSVPPNSPPARTDCALAYDMARQRVVLFGGEANNTVFDDTWEWDGSTWTQHRPGSYPAARSGHAMTCDPSGGGVILFGGIGNGLLTDTWTWDGASWAQRGLAGPAGRYGHGMAHDLLRRRVVLHGGSAGSALLADTWEWDGVVWQQQAGASLPRSDLAMAYDAAGQNVVVFGGADGSSLPADTWTWDGRQWARRLATEAPISRQGHAMVFDGGQRQIMMFGGLYPGSQGTMRSLDETWVWDRVHWVLRRPSTSPAARGWHALAYDALRQRVVLFGGAGALALFADTWEWDGNAWQQRTPLLSPPPRARHAVAYDGARQRLVLFGGANLSGSNPMGDTWEWDGAAWIQRSPPTSPSPRSSHQMQYDIARQRVVLFGGWASSVPMTDTWEWDGTTWMQTAATGPSISTGGMAFDESRQRVVLVGGSSFGAAAQTWEWDGSTWAQRATGGPPGRFETAMAYDAAAQRIMMFGGPGAHPIFPIVIYYGDTWLYGDLGSPSATPIGSACAGTNGSPVLASDGPYLGAPAFALELLSARGMAPCAFALATTTQNLAIGGGCTLYLRAPLTIVLAMTSPVGFASTRFAVPVIPALRGAALFAQAFVADPQGAAGGFAVTAGRRLVVGD